MFFKALQEQGLSAISHKTYENSVMRAHVMLKLQWMTNQLINELRFSPMSILQAGKKRFIFLSVQVAQQLIAKFYCYKLHGWEKSRVIIVLGPEKLI